jgi:RNA recognition motif-containing protein
MIITDREGRARGFAFVEMSDPQSAGSATKALEGRELGGQALRVDEASDRTVIGRGGRRRASTLASPLPSAPGR